MTAVDHHQWIRSGGPTETSPKARIARIGRIVDIVFQENDRIVSIYISQIINRRTGVSTIGSASAQKGFEHHETGRYRWRIGLSFRCGDEVLR
jgi:hypothetical protein